MSDENFLDDKSKEEKSVTTDTKPASYGPVVDALVGEGKKFRTLEDLARGKAESDDYIEQLKRENSELREDVGKGATMAEILDNLKKEAEAKGETKPSITEEDLAKLVESKLSEHEKAQTEKSNKQKVDEALIKKFGDGEKVESHIKAKASELGMTTVELKAMANSNPAVFLRLVDIDPNATEGNKGVPAGHSTNTEALMNQKPTGIVEGSYEYYKQIRQTDPKRYYSPAIQNEMFENRRKMGDAFFK